MSFKSLNKKVSLPRILTAGLIATALGGCGDNRQHEEGLRATDSDTRWSIETDIDSASASESESESEPPPPLATDGEVDGDAGDQDTDTATAEAPDSEISPDTDTAITITTCVEFTRSEEICLDCCDCVLEVCADRGSCREACGDRNFGNNRFFIDFEVPTDPNRDTGYTTCLMRGEADACDACCDCSTTARCGDFKYCRSACAEELY